MCKSLVDVLFENGNTPRAMDILRGYLTDHNNKPKLVVSKTIRKYFQLNIQNSDLDYKTLLKDKWLYYNGKLSQGEMDMKGWEYDPLNGLTVLKGDMDKYYDADPIIQEHQIKIHYTQEMVDALKEIMDNIKWRHQSIKNAIEWHKFVSGA